MAINRFQQTAPGVYVSYNEQRTASPDASNIKKWVFTPSMLAAVFGFLFFSGGRMMTINASNTMLIIGTGLVGAGFIGALVLMVTSLTFDRSGTVIINESTPLKPEPAREPDNKLEIDIRTAHGRMVIVQPRPGAFSSWLRDVINPDNKTSFSKNEAKRREWEDWQYINLVAQLKGGGWLHQTRTINGAPDIDTQYLTEMRTWLETPLL